MFIGHDAYAANVSTEMMSMQIDVSQVRKLGYVLRFIF